MAIELLADTEKKLVDAARSEGKNIETIIAEMLAERSTINMDEPPEYKLPRKEWLQRFHEWLDSFDAERRPLINECLTREYIYFDTKF